MTSPGLLLSSLYSLKFSYDNKKNTLFSILCQSFILSLQFLFYFTWYESRLRCISESGCSYQAMPSVCYIQVLSCRKDQDVNQCFWLLTAKLTGNLALAIAHSVTDTSESPADDPQHQHQRPVDTGLFLLRHAQCEFRVDTVKNNITDFQCNFRFYGKEYIVWLWEDGGWYIYEELFPERVFLQAAQGRLNLLSVSTKAKRSHSVVIQTICLTPDTHVIYPC